MTINMSILHQSSDLPQAKVYYSNIRHQFCMSWALRSLRTILHFRKYSKHCKKVVTINRKNVP